MTPTPKPPGGTDVLSKLDWILDHDDDIHWNHETVDAARSELAALRNELAYLRGWIYRNTNPATWTPTIHTALEQQP